MKKNHKYQNCTSKNVFKIFKKIKIGLSQIDLHKIFPMKPSKFEISLQQKVMKK